MDLQVIRVDDVVSHIALRGRLDAAGVQEVDSLYQGYTVARRKPVLVDLSGVDFLASLGLRLFILVAKSLAKHKLTMVLVAPQGEVAKTLAASGITDLIPSAPNVEAAMSLLGLA